MSSRSVIASVLLLGLLGACDRHIAGNEQAAPPPSPQQPAHAIDRSHAGDAAPAVRFSGPDGQPTTLAAVQKGLKGKPLLVNLWATWCGPCVNEMPTLNVAASTFPVAAIAQDKDRATVAAYLAKAHLTNIKPYVDETMTLSVGYNASLPMSILLDANGREVWRTMGAMDWTAAKAKALLAEAR